MKKEVEALTQLSNRRIRRSDASMRMLSVLSELRGSGCRRIALFGAGQHTRKVQWVLEQQQDLLVAVVDDRARAGEFLFDIPVVRPDAMASLELDAVVVSSDAFEPQLVERLGGLDIGGAKVVRLYDALAGSGTAYEMIRAVERLLKRGFNRIAFAGTISRCKELESFASLGFLPLAAFLQDEADLDGRPVGGVPVEPFSTVNTCDAVIFMNTAEKDRFARLHPGGLESVECELINDERFFDWKSRRMFEAEKENPAEAQVVGPEIVDARSVAEYRSNGPVVFPFLRSTGRQRKMSEQGSVVIATDTRFWDVRFGSSTRISALINHLSNGLRKRVVIFFVGTIDLNDLLLIRSAFTDLEIFYSEIEELQPPISSKTLSDYYSHRRLMEFEEVLARVSPFAVIVEYVRLCYLVEGLDPALRAARLFMVDTHDVMHLRKQRFNEKGKVHWLDIDAAQERLALSSCDVVLAIQNEDRRLLETLVSGRPVVTVGHGHQRHPFSAPASPEVHVLFVGGNNEPNAAALQLLLEQVWTDAVQRSGAILDIYGEVCDAVDEDRLPAGVKLHGLVDDLDPAYHSAGVVVNPVRFGGGLKIKNVEALCFAKPLVTTTVGAEGMESGIGIAFQVADDPADMTTALLELICSGESRKEWGIRAQAFAEKQFSEKAVFAELDQALEQQATQGLINDGAGEKRSPIAHAGLTRFSRKIADVLVMGPARNNGFLYEDAFRNSSFDFAFTRDLSPEAIRSHPAKLFVVHDDAGIAMQRAIQAARDSGKIVLLVEHGILEWRNIWHNPVGWVSGSGRPQPAMADYVAAIGSAHQRILQSWGNERVEVTGLPRLARLPRSSAVARHSERAKTKTVLISTAKSIGFSDAEKQHCRNAMHDLHAWFERQPDLNVIWRISPELECDYAVSDFKLYDLNAAMAEADVLITTPSTLMLEAMYCGMPVGLIDYNAVPSYLPAVWNINSPDQIPAVVSALLNSEDRHLHYQDTLAADYMYLGNAQERLQMLIEGLLKLGGTNAEMPDHILPEPSPVGAPTTAPIFNYSAYRETNPLKEQYP